MLGKSVMAILITAAIGIVVWHRMPLGVFVLLDVIVLATLYAPRQEVTLFDKGYGRYQGWKANKESTIILIETPLTDEEPKASRLRQWGLALKGRLNRLIVPLARFKPKPVRISLRPLRKKPVEPVVTAEPPAFKKTRSQGWVDPYLKRYEDTETGDNKKAA